ncbi:MAG: PHB depolymerase family esterase [Alphaproteobacteria bacterium]
MRKNRLSCLLTGLIVALCCIPGPAQARRTATADYAGREYALYTPASVKGAAPLLVVLHGGGGNANWMHRQLDWDSVADHYGFRIAFLNGTDGKRFFTHKMRSWNAGNCCGPAAQSNANDNGYISGFIGMMSRQGLADARRVYLMGHSNGAMMIYRFACTYSDQIAAAVVVSGSVQIEDICKAPRLPMLHVHGLDDVNVPVAGGKGIGKFTGDLMMRSVQQSDDFMKAAGASVQTILLPNTPHALAIISENMEKQTGKTLAETAAQFFQGKSAAAR